MWAGRQVLRLWGQFSPACTSTDRPGCRLLRPVHSLVPRLRVTPAQLGSDTPAPRVTALTQMAPGGLCPDQATERPRDPCSLCAHSTGWETGDKDQGQAQPKPEPAAPRASGGWARASHVRHKGNGHSRARAPRPRRLLRAWPRCPSAPRQNTGQHRALGPAPLGRGPASGLGSAVCSPDPGPCGRDPSSHTPWRSAAAPRPARAPAGIASATGLPRVGCARGHFRGAKSQAQSGDAPVPAEVESGRPIEVTRL